MTLTMTLTDHFASVLDRRTSRRGFVGRTAIVGSAVAVSGTDYVLRPGTAYASICRCPRQAVSGNQQACGCGDLCCDGYTEFCCQIYGENSCPTDSILAGWWKVDNSTFCDGAARYYMDCNQSSPRCSCGDRGVCRPADSTCGCRSCDSRADGCTTFRYGNCNNDVACVGPIMCRVVTCTKPWEIDPGCSTVARTDPATAFHHRPCLEAPVEATTEALAFASAVFIDYLERPPTDSEQLEYATRFVSGESRSRISSSLAASAVYVGFFVDSIYLSVFGRAADTDGRDYWTNQIIGGLTPADVAALFYGSAEFFAGSSSVVGYVTRLYQEILGREPEPDGLDFWVVQVETDDDRLSIAESFYSSAESRRRRVTNLYLRFLDREPEEAGLDYWAEQLLVEDDLELATFLSGSEEYLARAIARFAP